MYDLCCLKHHKVVFWAWWRRTTNLKNEATCQVNSKLRIAGNKMFFLPKNVVGHGLNSRGGRGKVADDDGTTIVTDADAKDGDESHHIRSQPQLMLIIIIWDLSSQLQICPHSRNWCWCQWWWWRSSYEITAAADVHNHHMGSQSHWCRCQWGWWRSSYKITAAADVGDHYKGSQSKPMLAMWHMIDSRRYRSTPDTTGLRLPSELRHHNWPSGY